MFFYNAFLLSLFFVALSANAICFLLAWELMSLASYFLVVFERHKRRNVRAGLIYLVMTHVATGFLLIMFFILGSHAGSYAFTDFELQATTLPPLAANLVFILALIGFGTKAGIIPLHVWLPEAHPAAPSSISALMSGVMIKTGILMLIRVTFTFLPQPMLWWGIAILIIAAISSLLGVLYALTEHDIKRLLAYHSIENIGIILLGLGAALVFKTMELPALAAISLIAALYHTMNHALFKTLLFFGAGTVVNATNTRNMELYGGLIKRLPYTAALFLIGSLAISGIVPFNGFVSEWLTFQSLFSGLSLPGLGSRSVFLIATGALAFTSGLAAACFVKVFGITFLARPRAVENTSAQEGGVSMLLACASIALLCLLTGIFPTVVLGHLSTITHTILQTEASALTTASYLPAPAMMIVFGSLVVGMGAALLISQLSRKQKTITAVTWNCGTPLTPRMEITATGFSRSLITVFRGVLRPTKQSQIEYQDAAMRYLPTSHSITLHTHNIYAAYLYRPLARLAVRLSHYMAQIQSGSTNAYVLYIFVTVIGLLIWVTR
jgi:hydrogenase-4 component B